MIMTFSRREQLNRSTNSELLTIDTSYRCVTDHDGQSYRIITASPKLKRITRNHYILIFHVLHARQTYSISCI